MLALEKAHVNRRSVSERFVPAQIGAPTSDGKVERDSTDVVERCIHLVVTVKCVLRIQLERQKLVRATSGAK